MFAVFQCHTLLLEHPFPVTPSSSHDEDDTNPAYRRDFRGHGFPKPTKGTARKRWKPCHFKESNRFIRDEATCTFG